MNFSSKFPQPITGLAPMDGMTDVVFRRSLRRKALRMSCLPNSPTCEPSAGMGVIVASVLYRIHERPVVVADLSGRSCELFYTAAHVVCELGFDGLDINMGCPSKNVASSGIGRGFDQDTRSRACDYSGGPAGHQ